MRTCVSFCIVENIRRGMSVQEACAEGLRRIKALKPKNQNLATMHPKLVVGVIAMDKFGNVSASYLFFGCFSNFFLLWFSYFRLVQQALSIVLAISISWQSLYGNLICHNQVRTSLLFWKRVTKVFLIHNYNGSKTEFFFNYMVRLSYQEMC
jgi:hypothetical protein